MLGAFNVEQLQNGGAAVTFHGGERSRALVLWPEHDEALRPPLALNVDRHPNQTSHSRRIVRVRST